MSEEVTVKTEPEDDEENGRTTPVRKSVQEYEQAMNYVVSPSSGSGVTIKQENPPTQGESTVSVAGSTVAPENSNVVRNNESVESAATEAVDNADVTIPTKDTDTAAAAAAKESVKDPSARSETDGTVPTTDTSTFSTSDTNLNLSAKAADNEDINVNQTATEISTNGVLVKDEPHDIDLADLEKTMACFDGQSNEKEATPPPPPQITSLTPPPPPQEICTTPLPLPSLADKDGDNTKQSSNDLSPEVIGAMVKEELPDKDFAELQVAAEEAGIEHSDNSKETGHSHPPTSPKISTVPMLRLRVKPEFSTLPQEEGVQQEQEFSSLPQDFFDGILTENIAARPMIRPKDEPIPDNFFDDLLVDKVQQRIEAAETQDLEVKYGDRLKQLEKLEQELAKEKRKHKKLKKKSKKRQRSPSPTSRRRGSRSPSSSRRRRSHSRSPMPPRRRGSRSPSPSRRRRSHSRSPPRRRLSRSPSPSRRRKSHSRSPPPRRRASRSPSLSRRRNSRTRSPPPRRRGSRSHTPEQRKHKLMRWPEKSEFDDRIEIPSTSKRKRPHGVAADMRVDDGRRVEFKQERRIVENISPIKVKGEKLPRRHAPVADVEIHDDPLNEDMQPHLPELGEEITAKQKRDRIILRAKTLMKYLKVMEMEKDKPLSTFLYTSIVRKLPASHSYRNQHIYENRSPLHNVNNVTYKFNSHARRFNLEEWGLASLPPVAANIAKLVGYDAQTIHNKLKVIKIPAKIRKIKREDGEDDDEDEEELLQGRSSLFCNASTQTDETVDVLKRKPQGYDIGVQAVQPAFEIACQTLETESPSIKMYDNNDDLPIMGIMREMNDNQLMALHDFAELLKEPPTSAMDMYRLRQRMLDIYKCSQLPSAMSAPAAAALNSYSSNESSPSSRVRHSEQGSGIRINSVEGGDGSYFAVNDPRVNFINYRNRDIQTNTTVRHMSPNDPRNSSRRAVDSSKSSKRQEIKSTAAPSDGPKYYGRGGLRR